MAHWRVRRNVMLALAIVVSVFFVLTVGALLRWSLHTEGSIGVGPGGELTVGNYGRVFTDWLYLRALWTTLHLSAVATFYGLLLGLPIAYWMVRTESGRVRAALIIVVAIPFMTSLIVRLYALLLVLGNTGLANRTLQMMGILDPHDFIPLIRNNTGVIIGLTYFVLPFVVFTMAGVIRRFDESLEEAALNLGADKISTFIHIVLPLLAPGIFGAATLAFVLAGTAFATPLILGGGAVVMVANSIYDQAMFVQNLPMAATLSAVALVFTIACVYLGQRLVRQATRA